MYALRQCIAALFRMPTTLRKHYVFINGARDEQLAHEMSSWRMSLWVRGDGGGGRSNVVSPCLCYWQIVELVAFESVLHFMYTVGWLVLNLVSDYLVVLQMPMARHL